MPSTQRFDRRRSTVDGLGVYPYRCCCKKCHPLMAVMAICIGHVAVFSVFLLNSIFNSNLEKIGSTQAVMIDVLLLLIFGAAIVLVLYGFWKTKPKFLYFHLFVQVLWIGCLVCICIFLGLALVGEDQSANNKAKAKGDVHKNYQENIVLTILCAVFALLECWWVTVVWRSGVLYLRFKAVGDAEQLEQDDVVKREAVSK